MVAVPQPDNKMTPQEYLDWEEKQPIKYEYMNGRVFAMTGGTLPHNEIALNLAMALKNHLRGKGCSGGSPLSLRKRQGRLHNPLSNDRRQLERSCSPGLECMKREDRKRVFPAS